MADNERIWHLSFYLALVWARVLGLIYFINSDRLDWQKHSYGRLP